MLAEGLPGQRRTAGNRFHRSERQQGFRHLSILMDINTYDKSWARHRQSSKSYRRKWFANLPYVLRSQALAFYRRLPGIVAGGGLASPLLDQLVARNVEGPIEVVPTRRRGEVAAVAPVVGRRRALRNCQDRRQFGTPALLTLRQADTWTQRVVKEPTSVECERPPAV
jgi:hypothetical protein